jgi:hypothetical protein
MNDSHHGVCPFPGQNNPNVKLNIEMVEEHLNDNSQGSHMLPHFDENTWENRSPSVNSETYDGIAYHRSPEGPVRLAEHYAYDIQSTPANDLRRIGTPLQTFFCSRWHRVLPRLSSRA